MEKYVGICVVAMIMGLIMIVTGIRIRRHIKEVYIFMMISFGVLIMLIAALFLMCFGFFVR